MTLNQMPDEASPVRRDASPASLSIERIRRRIRDYSYRPIAADDTAITHAVLVPLYQLGSELHVILTKRTTQMTRQPGHISFPGGGRERADRDLRATALRESFEEIGLDPRHVEVLGRIDDFSTRDGKILIAGFVGLIDPLASPYPWRPAETEVAEILEVPLRHLLDSSNVIIAAPRELNGRLWPDESFLFRGHRTFGATARTLRHVLDIGFAEV